MIHILACVPALLPTEENSWAIFNTVKEARDYPRKLGYYHRAVHCWILQDDLLELLDNSDLKKKGNVLNMLLPEKIVEQHFTL